MLAHVDERFKRNLQEAAFGEQPSERVKGIEPSYSAWKSRNSATRVMAMVAGGWIWRRL
jgi:hypothetical protein